MTERHVVHGNIRLERLYDASCAEVFAAWASPEALMRWSAPGQGWDIAYDRFDFRPGGECVCRFGPQGGETCTTHDRYEDIVPDSRIVMTNNMTAGDTRIFVGLVTVEFYPEGNRCRMLMAEQGVFLDGHDKPEDHEAGWTLMVDTLGRVLADRT